VTFSGTQAIDIEKASTSVADMMEELSQPQDSEVPVTAVGEAAISVVSTVGEPFQPMEL